MIQLIFLVLTVWLSAAALPQERFPAGPCEVAAVRILSAAAGGDLVAQVTLPDRRAMRERNRRPVEFRPFQLLLIVVIVVAASLCCIALRRMLLAAKKSEGRKAMEALEKRDIGWSGEKLTALACNTYRAVQKALSELDRETLERLVEKSDALHNSFWVPLLEMEELGRRLIIEVHAVDEASLVSIQNFRDDSRDSFTVQIHAKVRKYRESPDAGGFIAPVAGLGQVKSPSEVPVVSTEEYWTFRRAGEGWLVVEICDRWEWEKACRKKTIDERG